MGWKLARRSSTEIREGAMLSGVSGGQSLGSGSVVPRDREELTCSAKEGDEQLEQVNLK